MIIGIIGPKLAGKDTAARYYATQYGAATHAHSDILYQILCVLDVPASRDNAIKLSALREVFGSDVLIGALNKRIADEAQPLTVVTGVRFQNELDNIRSYPDHALIYVTAPIELRYAWQQDRAERMDDIGMSFAEFEALESRNTEVAIRELGEQADYHIRNVGTIEDFQAKCDEIIADLKSKYVF